MYEFLVVYGSVGPMESDVPTPAMASDQKLGSYVLH